MSGIFVKVSGFHRSDDFVFIKERCFPYQKYAPGGHILPRIWESCTHGALFLAGCTCPSHCERYSPKPETTDRLNDRLPKGHRRPPDIARSKDTRPCRPEKESAPELPGN